MNHFQLKNILYYPAELKKLPSTKSSRQAVGPIQLPVLWEAEMGDLRQGRRSYRSPPSSTKVKNKWSYNYSQAPIFHGVDREKFTFLPLNRPY